MMKELSFIPRFNSDAIDNARTSANNQLEILQRLVEAHGETLTDAAEYQSKGADYKVKAREAECIAWLDKTKAPQYVRAQSIEAAINDLGAANLDYWESLTNRLVIRLGNSTLSPVVSLAKDVVIDSDGCWSVSPERIAAEKEKHRVTLDARQLADLAEFQSLFSAYTSFVAKGYPEARNMLAALIDFNDDEELARYVCSNYFSGKDTRLQKIE